MFDEDHFESFICTHHVHLRKVHAKKKLQWRKDMNFHPSQVQLCNGKDTMRTIIGEDHQQHEIKA